MSECTCLFSGCEEGWVSGHGLCYRLMTQFATFDRATEKCRQMDAHLLTIENQKESDFISDWLTAVTSKVIDSVAQNLEILEKLNLPGWIHFPLDSFH